MKAHYSGIAGLLLTSQLLTASAFANDGGYTITRDTVIPVSFNDQLRISRNRAGDRFSANVIDSRDFPRGTRLDGHVQNIIAKRDNRPAYMDLMFDAVVYPDGTRQNIAAVPVSLDSKGVYRDRDGRLRADTSKIRSENYVLGGFIGGLVVGSLIKKPFEGAFIGAIAGILAGEALKNQSDIVADRGTKVGALIQRDFTTRYGDQRYDGRRDPYDYDNYGRQGASREGDAPWRGGRNNGDVRYDRYGNPIGEEGRWQRDVISYEGRDLQFDREQPAYRVDDVLMVPVESAARQLGLTVERPESSNMIFVQDDTNFLKLEQDSTAYRLNGKRGTLRHNVENKKGVLYVPIEVLAAMKERPVYVNGAKVGDFS